MTIEAKEASFIVILHVQNALEYLLNERISV